MPKTKDDTIKFFRKIKKELLSWLDDLDSSFEQCEHCSGRKFTNKSESLLAVEVRKLIRRIDSDLENLQ